MYIITKGFLLEKEEFVALKFFEEGKRAEVPPKCFNAVDNKTTFISLQKKTVSVLFLFYPDLHF